MAAEPPVSLDDTAPHDEKVKVLRAIRPIDVTQMVRGQYRTYRDEPGVDPQSTTETFVAARLDIDSWRWAGVPWYVRAGKAMAESVTDAIVELQQPPRLLFEDADDVLPHPNILRFRLGKDDGVTLTVQAKAPGQELLTKEVDLSVDFAAALGERHEPYERLIYDAIDGSTRRFARQDIVEQTWRIVQPALDDPGPIHFYERGSWGPGRGQPAARRRPLALRRREARVRLEVVEGGPARLAERAAVWLADRILAAVSERGAAHLAVSGGSTPATTFVALAILPVPWDRVHIWQVDERVAPDGDPERNATAPARAPPRPRADRRGSGPPHGRDRRRPRGGRPPLRRRPAGAHGRGARHRPPRSRRRRPHRQLAAGRPGRVGDRPRHGRGRAVQRDRRG